MPVLEEQTGDIFQGNEAQSQKETSAGGTSPFEVGRGEHTGPFISR